MKNGTETETKQEDTMNTTTTEQARPTWAGIILAKYCV